jgi:hypothetical protein
MDLPTLYAELKGMSERTHRHFDKNKHEKYAKRQPSYHFDMGAYAVIDNLLQAIENGDEKTLQEWYKEEK